MRCLTEPQYLDWLREHEIAVQFDAPAPALASDFELLFQTPTEARTQRMLARDVATWLAPFENSLLWLFGSPFQKPDELAILAGLRRAHGEERPISAAPGHLFASRETDELTGWLSLLMGFNWDACLVCAPGQSMMFRMTHDEYLCLLTSDPDRFASAREFVRKYDVDIYRETET